MEPGRHPRRPTGMRRSFLVLLLALVGLTLVPSGGPASASCAGPSVEVPRTLVRGGTVEVVGSRFVDGCRDSMSCPVGCNAGECEYDEPPEKPSTDVTLTLTQGWRHWDLGTVDADEHGTVRWSVTVPDDVRRGRARLGWGPEQSQEVRITAG